jgi:hypothetical protein
MSVTCNQCAVWRPAEEVSFGTKRAALEHAVYLHGNRVVSELLSALPPSRIDDFIEQCLVDCRAADKVKESDGAR